MRIQRGWVFVRLLARINGECQTAREKPKSEKSKSCIGSIFCTKKPENQCEKAKSQKKTAKSRKVQQTSRNVERPAKSRKAQLDAKSRKVKNRDKSKKYGGRLQVEKSTSRNIENDGKRQNP